MKKRRSSKFNLDAECNFSDLPEGEIETACKYEYMRESQVLRDGIKKSRDRSKETPLRRQNLPSFFRESRGDTYRGVLVLRRAGFPKPWNQLGKKEKKNLVLVISEWETERKKIYPPVVIENATVTPDLNRESEQAAAGRIPRRPVLRLEPSKPDGLDKLLRPWGRSEGNYFFGFIRVDESYNETEARKAFKEEFRKRWGKTKGGGGAKWRARLKQLAVMRIWKQECNRKPADYIKQWKRLKLVAKFCGYKGCVKEEYSDRMNESAKVEMSSARADARTYFQSLFPGEEPLSY